MYRIKFVGSCIQLITLDIICNCVENWKSVATIESYSAIILPCLSKHKHFCIWWRGSVSIRAPYNLAKSWVKSTIETFSVLLPNTVQDLKIFFRFYKVYQIKYMHKWAVQLSHYHMSALYKTNPTTGNNVVPWICFIAVLSNNLFLNVENKF